MNAGLFRFPPDPLRVWRLLVRVHQPGGLPDVPDGDEPAGYTFGDFAKVGLPLTVLLGVVVVTLVLVLYPA